MSRAGRLDRALRAHDVGRRHRARDLRGARRGPGRRGATRRSSTRAPRSRCGCSRTPARRPPRTAPASGGCCCSARRAPWKRVLARLTNAQKLALADNPHGSVPALLQDCLDAAVDDHRRRARHRAGPHPRGRSRRRSRPCARTRRRGCSASSRRSSRCSSSPPGAPHPRARLAAGAAAGVHRGRPGRRAGAARGAGAPGVRGGHRASPGCATSSATCGPPSTASSGRRPTRREPVLAGAGRRRRDGVRRPARRRCPAGAPRSRRRSPRSAGWSRSCG